MNEYPWAFYFCFLRSFCLFSDSGAFLLDECSNDALYCCSGGFGSESIPILQIETSGVYENDLEHQILYILQYKSSLYWGYISIYIAVIPGIVLFIIYAAVLWSCIIVGIVLLLTILDVFIFRHLFRKVGQLLEANQELKRMEAIIENQ